MSVSNKKSVLVLDKNYFPHRIAPWKRAMKLVFGSEDKVEILKMYDDAPTKYDVSVIRLIHRSLPPYFKKMKVKFYKKYLFMRDNHKCQYCGLGDRSVLTIDHVIPKSRGGENSYQNCVTACLDCNNIKGNMTPEEAGMTLIKEPSTPTFGYLVNPRSAPLEWQTFLF